MSQLITATEVKTMSSKEIADLVEQRHDNVKRTIETLGDRGVITLPQIEEVSNAGPGPRAISVYSLDKRSSLIVVAQLSPEFTARIVDRWQELEAQAGVRFQIPTTMAGALRLAAEQAEEIERQQLLLTEQKPKVEFVERYVEAKTGERGVREVAKLLQANEREFVAFLIDGKVMFREGKRLTPYKDHINLGRIRLVTGDTEGGYAYMSPKFTAKGISWVAGEWSKYKVVLAIARGAQTT